MFALAHFAGSSRTSRQVREVPILTASPSLSARRPESGRPRSVCASLAREAQRDAAATHPQRRLPARGGCHDTVVCVPDRTQLSCARGAFILYTISDNVELVTGAVRPGAQSWRSLSNAPAHGAPTCWRERTHENPTSCSARFLRGGANARFKPAACDDRRNDRSVPRERSAMQPAGAPVHRGRLED